MSSQAASGLMHLANDTPSLPLEPEVAKPCVKVQSSVDFRIKLDQLQIELFKYQIYYAAEVKRSQTFQGGFEVQQQKCLSMLEEYDSKSAIIRQELVTSRKDLELANKLIETQKEMLDLQAQQQLPTSQVDSENPLLPHYSNQNSSYQSYYQPSRGSEFVIDPAGLRQLDDYHYNNIETSIDDSGDTQLAPVTEFDHQTSNISIASILQPVSAERDVLTPANIGGGGKRGSDDEGAKTNKKRRTK